MFEENVFSDVVDDERADGPRPGARREFRERLIAVLNLNRDKLRQYFARATGSFTYITHGKRQIFTPVINSIEDALVVASIITGTVGGNAHLLPAGFTRTYNLLTHVYPLSDKFIYNLKEDIGRYFQTPTRETRIFKSVVRNPTGKHMQIATNGATFKKYFKSIKLRQVEYKIPSEFSIKDYEIKNHCVPSYLEKVLTKTEYAKIKEDLEKNPTPTYPILTKSLNSIGYNLDVYIIDGENIQKQNEHKKTIRILISNNHLYDIKLSGGSSVYKKLTNNIIEKKQYDDIYELNNNKLITYSDNEIVVDSTKYTMSNRFKELGKEYNLTNVYSPSNLDFYENCGIRASRYCDDDAILDGAIDIDSCYINILSNKNYSFPIQTGMERTEKYSGFIRDWGFYYCEFKDKKKIDDAIFGFSDRVWIMGYLIKNLSIKNRINIIYEHVANSCNIGRETEYHKYMNNANRSDPKRKDYKILITEYTGTLAKYRAESSKYYHTEDENEKLGLLDKYRGKAYRTVSGVAVHRSVFMKRTGFYAYLGIISYSKYQLYKIYDTMNIKYKCDVMRIYTDSISFNIPIKQTIFNGDNRKDYEHVTYVNDKLSNLSIKVKGEKKGSHFKNVKHDIDSYLPDHQIMIKYDVDSVTELIDSDESFAIDGKAGYGKTHLLKNVIIPHFEKNNIKYLITSTTNENADYIDGSTIHSHLLKKDTTINEIIKNIGEYKYVIIEESTQITSDLLIMMDKIKNNTNTKFITIGDNNQCKSVDNIYWTKHEDYLRLMDNNIVCIKWHPKARYPKEYDDFLNDIMDKFDNNVDRNEINKTIREMFKNNKHDNSKLNIVWSHERGKKEKNYSTVHSIQGKTLTEQFTIFEWERMPKDVLYTALSRCSNSKLIELR